jgi:hypothetical protein
VTAAVRHRPGIRERSSRIHDEPPPTLLVGQRALFVGEQALVSVRLAEQANSARVWHPARRQPAGQGVTGVRGCS